MNGTDTQAHKGQAERKLNFKTLPYSTFLTMQNRLGLNDSQMGLALGMSNGIVGKWKRDGRVPKSAVLAAEALVRRQANTTDVIFVQRYVKGTLRTIATLQEEPEEITIKGQRFLLVPIMEEKR